MNILEEFWYGNIEPAEYDISSSKEYKELLQLISRNEEKLLATMTDSQKELFTKYGCRYCYANYSAKTVERLSSQHDPLSPLISGIVGPEDIIKERQVKSCKQCQMGFF